MSREAHVRICESVRVKFPRATRPLTAVIDLGFGFVTTQTLRLRALDAPEIASADGEAAKRALEKMVMKTESRILIRTTKSDKYDRYLVDVFAAGRYVNQKLLTQGLAVMVE